MQMPAAYQATGFPQQQQGAHGYRPKSTMGMGQQQAYGGFGGMNGPRDLPKEDLGLFGQSQPAVDAYSNKSRKLQSQLWYHWGLIIHLYCEEPGRCLHSG